jgi:hypothetical protein
VLDPKVILGAAVHDSFDRIILSFFAMWDYNRINKKKEAYCAREGITSDQEDEFVDVGDDSPLFR